jgi:SAM-dependent methyltransferase
MRPDRANKAAPKAANFDAATVKSFGTEWKGFDQSLVPESELFEAFSRYFKIFPWDCLHDGAEGFDMGCGSGRWAKLVAPRVGKLNCIDPSPEALSVAQHALASRDNVQFFLASANSVPLPQESQDFGYSLGVLHHAPDTAAALRGCADLLKPGAPLLVYLYYRFDNRPRWFRTIWRASEILRAAISRMPCKLKPFVTDLIAILIYLPLARMGLLAEYFGLRIKHMPLYHYRNKSLFTMRTDSRDRFGTPLEQRFTRSEIEVMMKSAGLTDITFSEEEPYWCVVGRKSRTQTFR